MAKFFVGQRVRKIGPVGSRWAGREALILERLENAPVNSPGGAYSVAPVIFRLHIIGHGELSE